MNGSETTPSIVNKEANILDLLDLDNNAGYSVCTADGVCYYGGAALNTDPDVDVITDEEIEQKGASSPGIQGQFATKSIGGNE